MTLSCKWVYFRLVTGFTSFLRKVSPTFKIMSEASQLVVLKKHTPGHTGNCKTVEGLTRDMKRIILFVRNAGKQISSSSNATKNNWWIRWGWKRVFKYIIMSEKWLVVLKNGSPYIVSPSRRNSTVLDISIIDNTRESEYPGKLDCESLDVAKEICHIASREQC